MKNALRARRPKKAGVAQTALARWTTGLNNQEVILRVGSRITSTTIIHESLQLEHPRIMAFTTLDPWTSPKNNVQKVKSKYVSLPTAQHLPTVEYHAKVHKREREEAVSRGAIHKRARGETILRGTAHEDLNAFLRNISTSDGFSHINNRLDDEHLNSEDYISDVVKKTGQRSPVPTRENVPEERSGEPSSSRLYSAMRYPRHKHASR